jgi:flagellar basal body-associated protein FliL
LETQGDKRGGRLWPIAIIVGLVIVVLVNALFIYIAVSGADDVVPSYNTEPR